MHQSQCVLETALLLADQAHQVQRVRLARCTVNDGLAKAGSVLETTLLLQCHRTLKLPDGVRVHAVSIENVARCRQRLFVHGP